MSPIRRGEIKFLTSYNSQITRSTTNIKVFPFIKAQKYLTKAFITKSFGLRSDREECLYQLISVFVTQVKKSRTHFYKGITVMNIYSEFILYHSDSSGSQEADNVQIWKMCHMEKLTIWRLLHSRSPNFQLLIQVKQVVVHANYDTPSERSQLKLLSGESLNVSHWPRLVVLSFNLNFWQLWFVVLDKNVTKIYNMAIIC